VDRHESFRKFQGMIKEQYDAMIDKDNFVVMDATQPVNKLQGLMRNIVRSNIDLKRFAPRRGRK
jgi:dTMP kinase